LKKKFILDSFLQSFFMMKIKKLSETLDYQRF